MRRRRDSKAFTLIEAMLAMAILAAAAAGILLPYAGGAAVQADAARRTLAAHLAADLMEEIAATDHASIITKWDGYQEDQGKIKNAQSEPENPEFLDGTIYADYSRHVDCDDSVGLGLIWVTVEVRHRGHFLLRLGTMLAEQG